MFEYIIGTVTDINSGYITVENNKIGYLIYFKKHIFFNFLIHSNISYINHNHKQNNNNFYLF